MSEASPSAAVYAFLDPLQRALSCVTREVLDVRGGLYPTPEPHELRLGDGSPRPLRDTSGRPAHVFLQVAMRYRIVGADLSRAPWTTEVTAYMYTLADRDGSEILAYHWHPDGASEVVVPHLHLGHGAQIGHRGLTEAHLPTGLVTLTDILHLVLDALDVAPLRPDWRAILDMT